MAGGREVGAARLPQLGHLGGEETFTAPNHAVGTGLH